MIGEENKENQTRRVFLAFHVPETAGRAILYRLADFRLILYPAENLHVTFKFIGEVSPQDLERVKTIGSFTMAQFKVFHFAPIGFFVEGQRLRLGVKVDQSLFIAQEIFTKELEKISLGKGDSKPYTPHITIGRLVEGFNLAAIRADLSAYVFDSDTLGLYQSEQGSNKLGVYTQLHSFTLKSGGAN